MHAVWVALSLATLLTVTYWNSLRVPLIFDDADSISLNPTIRSWRTAFLPPHDSGITVSGRPVLNATFALNYTLGGREMLNYRVTNIVVHWCAAMVLFGVVRRSLALKKLPCGKHESAQGDWLALGIATVWAVHPLQTESVTYLVQRAESLVGLFFLLTLYCFLRAYAPVQEGTPVARRAWWARLSVLACFLGMGSKEVMAGAPVVVLLFDRAFVSGSFSAAWRARKSYYAGLVATWGFLLLLVVVAGGRGGTVGLGGAISPLSYLFTQCEAIVHYVRLAVWPHPLVLDYGRYVVSGFGVVWAQALVITGLLAATVWACVRRPAAGFIGAWFFLLLAPTSSFIPVVSQTIAEHRMYLPLASVIVLCVLLVARWGRVPALVFCASAATVLSAATIIRNHDYRSSTTIWADTAHNRPQNERAWLALGATHVAEGRYADAQVALERGLDVNPLDADLLVMMAGVLYELGEYDRSIALFRDILQNLSEKFDASYMGHHNLGLVLVGVGRIDEGVEKLRKAISLKPGYAESHYALANALVKLNRPAEAISSYEEALKLAPDHIKARANLGNVLLAAGKAAEALTVMEPGLNHVPPSVELRFNLGVAENALGRPVEAARYFEECLRLKPGFAKAHVSLATLAAARGDAVQADRHFRAAAENGERSAVLLASWGRVLLKSGRVAEGVARLEEAVSAAPGDLQLEYFLADAYLAAGRAAEAAPRFEQLLARIGEAPELHNGLGLAYEQLGRLRDARAHFERALMLRTDYEPARINLKRIRISE